MATALIIAVPRFVINIPIPGIPSIKICCDFIIIFLISTQISPVSGAIVAAVSNIIHTFLFPSGPFFPGFTLTDFLTGLIIGYLFKILNKKNNISFLACLVSIFLAISFKTVLNTVWFNIIYHIAFNILIWPRILAGIFSVILISPIAYKLSIFFDKIIKNPSNNLMLDK
ncbi:MAG: folate family ECF transporter S component [Oscillospiraceae bacterium]|nr:folate family ECF transporter S component [Oscillospiraceae bacterium]